MARSADGTPAGRSRIVRVTALVLAAVVNALYVLVLFSHRTTRAPLPPINAMIWIDPLEPPPQPPRAEAAARPHQQRPANAAPLPTVLIPQSPAAVTELDAAIEVPPVDWHAEAERAAERFARNDGERGKVSLDSQPKVLALPDKSNSGQARVEHFEGGVEMVIKGDCVQTRNPQAMQPWALDRVATFFGNRATAGGGCQPNPSRDRAEALEKAVKPEPATRIKIP